jgi:hypothetical protein
MGRTAHRGQYLVARKRVRGVDGRDGQVVARMVLYVLVHILPLFVCFVDSKGSLCSAHRTAHG